MDAAPTETREDRARKFREACFEQYGRDEVAKADARVAAARARLEGALAPAPKASKARGARRARQRQAEKAKTKRLLIDGPTEAQLAARSFATGVVGHEPVIDENGDVKAVRKVEAYRRNPLILTMWKRGQLEAHLYDACKWYLDHYEASGRGVRSCLDVGTGRGGGKRIGPTDEAMAGAAAARELKWCQRFIRRGDLDLFEAVVLNDATYAALGKLLYPALDDRTAARKVTLRFQLAASKLHEGIANRLQIR